MKRYFAALATRLGTIPEAAHAGFAQDRGHRNIRSQAETHMAQAPLIRRDTGAWRLQVWVSFGLSVRCAPPAWPGCRGKTWTAPSW
jgi:hypothetical protein